MPALPLMSVDLLDIARMPDGLYIPADEKCEFWEAESVGHAILQCKRFSEIWEQLKALFVFLQWLTGATALQNSMCWNQPNAANTEMMQKHIKQMQQ